jgi:hypothetical protein
MSLRDRLVRLLDRGDFEEPAPDTVVELDNVWLFEGPRLLQILENAGIDASGVESSNIATQATATTRMRLFVHYADFARATAVLEEHRRQLRSD